VRHLNETGKSVVCSYFHFIISVHIRARSGKTSRKFLAYDSEASLRRFETRSCKFKEKRADDLQDSGENLSMQLMQKAREKDAYSMLARLEGMIRGINAIVLVKKEFCWKEC